MKALLKDYLRTEVRYLLTVAGGTALFLTLAPLAGYLPHSDRPGPGWHAEPFSLSLSELTAHAVNMGGFALFLAPYLLIVGLIPFGVARGMERLRAPRLLVAVVGAVIAGFLSGYVVAAIGWYIAIGSAAVVVGMGLGAAFGAFQLPKRPPRASRYRPSRCPLGHQ